MGKSGFPPVVFVFFPALLSLILIFGFMICRSVFEELILAYCCIYLVKIRGVLHIVVVSVRSMPVFMRSHQLSHTLVLGLLTVEG